MKRNYSAKEVRGLVENYAELRGVRGLKGYGLDILIRLADLDRAVRMLPPKEYQAVLLHGLLTHTIVHAEKLLGVSASTLHDRYESGLDCIVLFLNEGEM